MSKDSKRVHRDHRAEWCLQMFSHSRCKDSMFQFQSLMRDANVTPPPRRLYAHNHTAGLHEPIQWNITHKRRQVIWRTGKIQDEFIQTTCLSYIYLVYEHNMLLSISMLFLWCKVLPMKNKLLTRHR